MSIGTYIYIFFCLFLAPIGLGLVTAAVSCPGCSYHFSHSTFALDYSIDSDALSLPDECGLFWGCIDKPLLHNQSLRAFTRALVRLYQSVPRVQILRDQGKSDGDSF